MKRLTSQSASDLPRDVDCPGYVPADHGVGIVHLGVGAFHRAHQAAYVDDALAEIGGDWRIRGVSLRSANVRDQLAPQDCLFTRVERSANGERVRLSGAIADILVAPEDPQAVIRAIADPAIHVVSLTITEKGYCHDPATGRLDEAHPDVVHDLANPQRPRGALGYLAEALKRRKEAGAPGLTLLCCDNLPDNGHVLGNVLSTFAELRDRELQSWIGSNVAFPSTMVDRIVPATTDDDIRQLSDRIGLQDQAMVKTEPFTQWVIEDRFAGPRPAFEHGGAQLVPDVRPFELAKLRMLNGAHSSLAYLGLRLGLTFVHEAVADSDLQVITSHLMRGEAAPTLPTSMKLTSSNYASALMERFANPALEHRLFQIAMDGSQKLPQRLLGTIRDRLSRGQSADAALLGVAGWITHATGRGPNGSPHQVDDPMAGKLGQATAAAGNDPDALARELLSIEPIFGNLGANQQVQAKVAAHVRGLLTNPRAWVNHIASELAEREAA